jgi:O-methyltransferase involved in polyketide biosynthesis
VAAELDPAAGLAIVTEGLLGYLPTTAVEGLWGRIARTLSAFDAGLYVSDLHLGSVQSIAVRGFRIVLSAFVRGRVHLHFADAQEAQERLRACGFAHAAVRPAGDLVHILEATTS